VCAGDLDGRRGAAAHSCGDLARGARQDVGVIDEGTGGHGCQRAIVTGRNRGDPPITVLG
jgi:hypothetical protein